MHYQLPTAYYKLKSWVQESVWLSVNNWNSKKIGIKWIIKKAWIYCQMKFKTAVNKLKSLEGHKTIRIFI